jgi:hypothetical protein
MILFINMKCFGVVDMGHRGLEGSMTVGGEWEALSIIISAIHLDLFPGFSIFFHSLAVIFILLKSSLKTDTLLLC